MQNDQQEMWSFWLKSTEHSNFDFFSQSFEETYNTSNIF
jgi:hypothetical protein